MKNTKIVQIEIQWIKACSNQSNLIGTPRNITVHTLILDGLECANTLLMSVLWSVDLYEPTLVVNGSCRYKCWGAAVSGVKRRVSKGERRGLTKASKRVPLDSFATRVAANDGKC